MAAEADDPDAALSEFLHTTYQAAAVRGGWDRAALEDDPDRLDHHKRTPTADDDTRGGGAR